MNIFLPTSDSIWRVRSHIFSAFFWNPKLVMMKEFMSKIARYPSKKPDNNWQWSHLYRESVSFLFHYSNLFISASNISVDNLLHENLLCRNLAEEYSEIRAHTGVFEISSEWKLTAPFAEPRFRGCFIGSTLWFHLSADLQVTNGCFKKNSLTNMFTCKWKKLQPILETSRFISCWISTYYCNVGRENVKNLMECLGQIILL